MLSTAVDLVHIEHLMDALFSIYSGEILINNIDVM